MTETEKQTYSAKDILKELGLCFIIALVLLMMDRNLENIYPFFLLGTGKRIIDLWISFEMHMHSWLKVLIPIAFLVWLIRNRFHVRLGLLLPILACYLCYLITSFFTSGITYRWWNTTECPLMMYLFISMQCASGKGARRLAFAGTLLYTVLLFLNALFIFFPGLYQIISGWEPEYFLSPDNLTGFPMFFGLLLAFLDNHYNHAKWRYRVYLALFLLNMVLIHCASALIAGMVLLLYLLLPAIRDLFRKLNFNIFTGLSVLLCVLLVAVSCYFFYSGNAPKWLYDITRQKRSIVIRFIIWCGVFKEILLQPFLGYGLGYDADFFLRPNTSVIHHAHNAYLQTWHEGGLPVMAAVFTVLFLFAKKLKTCRDRKLAGIFAVIVFSELIMMQSTIESWFTWFPVFVIIQMASLLCSADDS